MLFLYHSSQKLYTRFFKQHKQAWQISKDEFLQYPKHSLGYKLGQFYQENAFEPLHKLENHDVFHLITQTGTTVQDEISLQYLLLGNGKLSLYLLGVIVLGTCVYPEYCKDFYRAFKRGNSMQRFYQLDFKTLLNTPLHEIKNALHFNLKSHLAHYFFTPL